MAHNLADYCAFDRRDTIEARARPLVSPLVPSCPGFSAPGRCGRASPLAMALALAVRRSVGPRASRLGRQRRCFCAASATSPDHAAAGAGQQHERWLVMQLAER